MGLLYSEFANTGYNYQIFNSLAFRQSASSYISRVPTTSGNSQKWTWSGWVKFGSLSAPNLTYIAQNTSNQATYFGRSATTYPNKFFFLSQDTAVRINGVTEAVFNDPSAWYHIVVALDTTQATAATGLKIFVNGVLQNLVPANTVWTQNTNTFMSQASLLHLMGGWPANSFYSDQLYSEVNFVDGQQLDASYFGVIDQTSGQWAAKKYSGTYGINGFYLPFNDITGTSANRLTYSEDFTNAAWASGANMQYTANATTAPNGTTTADKLIANTTNGSHYNGQIQTALMEIQVYSVYLKAAEYIFATITVSNYATEAIGANFNLSTGTLQYTYGSVSDFTNVSAGIDPAGNGWYRCWIKYTKNAYNNYANPGIQLIDNSGSGSFAGNGVNGIYAWGAQVQTNALPGYYRPTTATALTTAVNNIAADQSNGSVSWNFWIPNNISLTLGSTYDSLKDVPSGSGQLSGTQPNSNYPTYNPLDGLNLGLSQTNLLSAPSQSYYATATMAFPSSGKWYVEFNIVAATNSIVGVSTKQKANNNSNLGSSTGEIGYYWNGQGIKENISQSGTWASFITNDVIGMAVDADAKTVSFYKNNVLTGSAISYSTFTSEILASFGTYFVGGQGAINFGQRPFSYTPPSGFKALCTSNLPVSAVVKGNTQMDATTFTGTGATRSVTNAAEFGPHIVWVKSQASVSNHFAFDVNQGTGSYMSTNASPVTPVADANTLTAFNSNGFSLGTGATGCNTLNDLEVAWQWKASDTPVTNTNGSITTTVRANAAAGISLITYTGTGVNGGSNWTVGHGLNTPPKFIISRCISAGSAFNWLVYLSTIGASNLVYMALTNGSTANTAPWGGVEPTSSVYTVYFAGGTNTSGFLYSAWAFAEVAGFSKFNQYFGTGNPDGPFIYCGFRPKLIMIKRTDSTSDWFIKDTSRSPYNVANQTLFTNTTAANANGDAIDILSNGFKIRHSAATGNMNTSGGTYFYAAWAENPFQNANAR